MKNFEKKTKVQNFWKKIKILKKQNFKIFEKIRNFEKTKLQNFQKK